LRGYRTRKAKEQQLDVAIAFEREMMSPQKACVWLLQMEGSLVSRSATNLLIMAYGGPKHPHEVKLTINYLRTAWFGIGEFAEW
jgi:hypothetical protein